MDLSFDTEPQGSNAPISTKAFPKALVLSPSEFGQNCGERDYVNLHWACVLSIQCSGKKKRKLTNYNMRNKESCTFLKS